MGGWTRRVLPGACGDPQPWNWYDVCALRPGHKGDHRRAHVRRHAPGGWTRWDLSWPGSQGPVVSVVALPPRAYVSEDHR